MSARLILVAAVLAALSACAGSNQAPPAPATNEVIFPEKAYIPKVDTSVPVTRPQDYRFKVEEVRVDRRLTLDQDTLGTAHRAVRPPAGPHLELIVTRKGGRAEARFEMAGSAAEGPPFILKETGSAGEDRTFTLSLPGEVRSQSERSQQAVGYVMGKRIGLRIYNPDPDYPAILCYTEEKTETSEVVRYFVAE